MGKDKQKITMIHKQILQKESKYNLSNLLSSIESEISIAFHSQLVHFCQHLMKTGKSDLTVLSYTQDIITCIKHFKSTNSIKHECLQSLPEELNQWRNFIKSRHLKVQPQSQKKLLSSLKSFAKFTQHSHLHSQLFFTLSKLISAKLAKKSPKPVAQENVFKILQEEKHKTLWTLLYGCGLRISEALSLTAQDIKTQNMNSHSITVLGKGNKVRQIPLILPVFEEIMLHIKKHNISENSPLFFDTKNKPLTRIQAAKEMEKLRNKLGLPPDTSPHSLRHSFVSHLIEQHASLKAIQTLVGHANLSTIQNYASVSVKHLQNIHQKAAQTWDNQNTNNHNTDQE